MRETPLPAGENRGQDKSPRYRVYDKYGYTEFMHDSRQECLDYKVLLELSTEATGNRWEVEEMIYE